jgi:hypothetical protein
MTKPIITAANITVGYLKSLVADIPDNRLTELAGKLPNHPAWQIGHVVFAYNGAVTLLGGASILAPGHEAKYGMGTRSSANRSDYPSKDELLAMLDKAHAAAMAAITANFSTHADKPNPIPGFEKMAPTIGDAVVFLVTGHTGGHAGQVSSWRREAGMPGLGF